MGSSLTVKIKYIKKYYTREVHIDIYIIRGGGVRNTEAMTS